MSLANANPPSLGLSQVSFRLNCFLLPTFENLIVAVIDTPKLRGEMFELGVCRYEMRAKVVPMGRYSSKLLELLLILLIVEECMEFPSVLNNPVIQWHEYQTYT